MNKAIVYALILLAMTSMVFAKDVCKDTSLSCVDAIKAGCLQGSINAEGKADIINRAHASYNIGLAVYQVFDKDDHTQLEHQVLFDSATGTVDDKSNLQLSVNLPGCQYQIDLFCGDVIEKFDQAHGIIYGDRKLDYDHKTTGPFCTKPVCGDGILTTNEQCDAGNDNGVTCTPQCDGSCTYCDNTCKNVVVTGSACPPPPPPNGVPEFSPFALGLAIIGVGLGLAFMRKH